MNRGLRTVGDHLYVAVLLPFDRLMKVDEQAYRRFLRHFLDNEKFVRSGGGLCINPEAGEIFYLSRQEKRRVLEIAMEEVQGKVPVIDHLEAWDQKNIDEACRIWNGGLV
jgi:4-hydroxy-tetrahydrodipicolinate synthase